MVGVVLLCIFINSFFLRTFYTRDKVKLLKEVNEQIVDAYADASMEESSFNNKLNEISRANNLSIVVVDANSNTLFATITGERDMEFRLLGYILGRTEDFETKHVVEDGGDYVIRRIMGGGPNGGENLELFGRYESGISLLMRIPIASIEESTRFANRFFIYVGLIGTVIGAVIIWFVTGRVTKPIQNLNDISSKMVNLDFDAKYEGNHHNEIGLLGDNINRLSDSLEKTISELKSANLELKKDIERKEQLDEMRMEFISNVSHELKTPIAIIQGYAEGLRDGVSDDPESIAYYCDVIVDESAKMNSMVKQFLNLNQLEFGGETINLERFNLTEMIKNYLASASVLAQQNNITVEFDDTVAVSAWGDEYKAEEVLTNYFSNAVHYCKEGSDGKKVIRITTENINNNVRICVYNSGDNIPKESIERLWEKFYKVDKARTREYGGSGVGLSIVKAIQESLGKDYGVMNNPEGVTFWYELEER
ncbi:MAG: HAMP domain-containing histidine kinase [Lachnospiraceae bacterium]|nr:HAMP domain-containing histidine kinase [Lachnospiraceae bacterium]